MKRIVHTLVAATLTFSALASPARAAISVSRSSSENPMQEVAKSTIYGGLAGLVLGAAITIAKDDHDTDPMKWGFVGGTFLGFGYGLYWVSSRPKPSAMIEVEHGKVALAVPTWSVEPRGMRVAVVGARF